MSNFDINVDRRTDGQTNGRTNGKADAYVAKSGGREMFHTKFDDCLLL